MNKSNIVLIGMAGSGKSTVGIILAKMAGMDFVDTDILIQTREEATLQEIVNARGYIELRAVEENTICELQCENSVIATGGSAVYSAAAMTHLMQQGLLVHLDVELDELVRRVGDFRKRGLAKRPDQSFENLFEERERLYQHFAQITVPHAGRSPEELSAEIIRLRS